MTPEELAAKWLDENDPSSEGTYYGDLVEQAFVAGWKAAMKKATE